jgi:AcrR family transcriptional regulator
VDQPEAPVEGLRERKKRRMRQLLSDTATRMFVERGFEAVRVAEIAAACEVSEKTVFNYFPSKEALLLDRLDGTVESVQAALADRSVAPVPAVLAILADELHGMTSMLDQAEDSAALIEQYRQVGALIQSTPALRAYQNSLMDQVTAVAAGILAERAGLEPQAPEPQIAATALLGLWAVQYRALGQYLDETRTPAQINEAVTADVRRAAALIEGGLSTLPAFANP